MKLITLLALLTANVFSMTLGDSGYQIKEFIGKSVLRGTDCGVRLNVIIEDDDSVTIAASTFNQTFRDTRLYQTTYELPKDDFLDQVRRHGQVTFDRGGIETLRPVCSEWNICFMEEPLKVLTLQYKPGQKVPYAFNITSEKEWEEDSEAKLKLVCDELEIEE